MFAVRPRRLSHLQAPTLRHRTRASRFGCSSGKLYSQGDSVGEATACGFECAGADGIVCIRKGIHGEVVEERAADVGAMKASSRSKKEDQAYGGERDK